MPQITVIAIEGIRARCARVKPHVEAVETRTRTGVHVPSVWASRGTLTLPDVAVRRAESENGSDEGKRMRYTSPTGLLGDEKLAARTLRSEEEGRMHEGDSYEDDDGDDDNDDDDDDDDAQNSSLFCPLLKLPSSIACAGNLRISRVGYLDD